MVTASSGSAAMKAPSPVVLIALAHHMRQYGRPSLGRGLAPVLAPAPVCATCVMLARVGGDGWAGLRFSGWLNPDGLRSWHPRHAGTRCGGPRGDQVRDVAAVRDASGGPAASSSRPGLGEPAVAALGPGGAGAPPAAVAPGVAAARERPALLAGVPVPGADRKVPCAG